MTKVAKNVCLSYDITWLTSTNSYLRAVLCFQDLTFYKLPFAMDLFVQQSISSAVTSAISIAIAAIQAKYDENMLTLCKLIKRFLLLKDFPFITPSPNLDATTKALLSIDTLLKALTNKQNQADLRYFDLHFDKVLGEGEIVSVDKDVYYKNMVLFVQYLPSLVIF